MTVLTMLFALLAAGLFGILFRFALRERRSLSLGGAFEFFDAFLQITDELLKPRILLSQLLIFEQKLLIRRRVHADLDCDKPRQLNEIMATFAVPGKMTLNKHVRYGQRHPIETRFQS